MKNNNEANFSGQKTMDMIDKTFSKDGFAIAERTQNAYVMPLVSQIDIDDLTPSVAYIGMEKIKRGSKAKVNPNKDPQSKKK